MEEQEALESALKKVEAQQNNFGFMDRFDVPEHWAVRKALEKQIPKKPDIEGDGYDPDGNLVYDTWICPCCGKYYELDYDDFKYCPECGQKIDWSE